MSESDSALAVKLPLSEWVKLTSIVILPAIALAGWLWVMRSDVTGNRRDINRIELRSETNDERHAEIILDIVREIAEVKGRGS